jgi:hypothetical protein
MAKASKDTKKLLEEARERFKKAVEADRTNRKDAIDDLKFAHEPGAQWDDATRTERGARPCYEFNRTRITVKRIVNDIRANRPQGKARAVEDGDKDTANVIEGLIRNIWNVSEADSAVDNAAEYQVAGGFGAWRVVTEYADESSWDQDIRVKGINNPFCLYHDHAALEPLKRDARYWFLTSKIAKETFEQKYGDKPAVEWEESEFDDESDWEDEDAVRVCEYWYRKPITLKLALLQDGKTVDLGAQQVPPEMIVRTRDVLSHKICMVVMSADRILEGPVEWPGKYFPFVPAYGEQVVIDGKNLWWGVVRHAKDAQRLHNYNLTLAAESASLAPQSKWWASPEQALGHTAEWARAHKENLPYLLFNPDPKNPGAPPRMPGGDVPIAFVTMAGITGEEIKSTTGIFDPSLGSKTNATSGIAKRAEIAQGEIATFNYGDNIARAIRRTWEILIDLIPKVYDTERAIRIIGTDGAESYVTLNSTDPVSGEVLNDLSKGQYDVTVTVGPSFSTQRQEAAEIYMGLAQANPAVFGVAGDLIFKSLDLPYAEDMAERMKTMLPPPVQQMIAQKEQQGGKPLPPEAQAAMQQASQAMQMVEQQSQLVQAAAAEVDTNKAEAEKAAADLEVKAAKLQADYHRMMGDLAKKEASLILKEAQVQIQQTGSEQDAECQRLEVESERQEINQQISAATQQIQSNAEAFMAAATQVLGQLAAASQKPESNKRIIVQRVNGALVGTVEVTE